MPRIITPPSSGSSPPGVDAGQAGFWAPSLGPFAVQATTGLAASRCYCCRVVCPLSQTITKLGFSVVTAASLDDPCDVGIYDVAGNLLRSSGSTTGKLNSTGAKTVPLSAPLAVVAGVVYYAAFASGPVGGTAGQVTMTTLTNFNLGFMFGAATGPNEMPGVVGVFPLPASLGASPASLGAVPILALMQ